MRSNDIHNKDDIRQKMQEAMQNNDKEAFACAMTDMMDCIAQETKETYESMMTEISEKNDASVMASRGIRQLTNAEKQYYQKLGEAMKAKDVKQALNNIDVVMPETVVNAVFDDLQTSHPLLSKIAFTPSSGAVKMLMNGNGYQMATWGTLCDSVVKELMSGFREVNTGLLKLSAFLPVCKAMLDLGPEWLDSYVRQVLYEALANGLEWGIVNGDGNESPIGMTRQVGDGVAVVGGAYPEKAKIAVTDLSTDTVGNLLSLIAVDANGKSRQVRDVILVVSPQDYFQKVMPATTVMAPDGTYRNDVLPYPMTIIQSPAVNNGEAVLGLAYKYFAAAGMEKEGRIEYSDHYQFVEDNRTYMIKLYANGFPMDNNAFLYLDISGLRPAAYKVEQVTAPVASTNAELADLKIGNLTLSPAFAAATTEYTATTTAATNTITAFPADAGAEIEVLVKPADEEQYEISNGTAAKWGTGENTVTINVTAADGSSTKSYTVTVTKS